MNVPFEASMYVWRPKYPAVARFMLNTQKALSSLLFFWRRKLFDYVFLRDIKDAIIHTIKAMLSQVSGLCIFRRKHK